MIFIVLLFIFIHCCQAEFINLVPITGGENSATFFDKNARDDCMKALCDLKDAFSILGYEIKICSLEQALAENIKTIVFDTLPLHVLAHHDPAKWFLFLWEPPTVLSITYAKERHYPFGTVFTMFDGFVDGNKYRKFWYPQPKLYMIDDIVPFAQKKLCTLIACNKKSSYPSELYSHRLEAIQYFERNAPQDFDFYGVGWPSSFATYKGLVDHKVPYLRQYKFSICYENMLNSGGYITEKIFDSFVAGCVPVYLGAQNIAKYIPANCYIAREHFATLEELYTFLNTMSEERYNQYLHNIRNFFASDAAFAFSIEYFIDTVLEAMIPGYDKNRIFCADQIEKIKSAKMIISK